MAGFREFITGEVLTAANVNDFLAKQAVMKFADAPARDSALGTAIADGNALRQGMVAYIDDVDELQKYDGSAWTNVVPDFVVRTGTDDSRIQVEDDGGVSVRADIGMSRQLPFAMFVFRTETISTGTSLTVTFPTGLFTGVPICTITPIRNTTTLSGLSGHVRLQPTESVTIRNDGSQNTGFNIHAIQLTP